MPRKKVAILGGGLSSLAAANMLSQYSRVTVYEADSEVGGLAKTFEHMGAHIPITYHHIQPLETLTLDYNKTVGGEVDYKRTTQCVYKDGKPYPLTSPLDVLKFSALSPLSRLRLAAFGARCVLPPLPPESADTGSWVNQWGGSEVLEKLYNPLSRIKFGLPATDMSARWLARRMREKIISRERHTPVDVKKILDYFTYNIESNSSRILVDTPVESVTEHSVNGEEYDVVVSGLPPSALLDVLEGDFPIDITKDLSTVEYKPVVSVVCSLKRPITKHYWNILLDEAPFRGFFDYSILKPDSDPAGGHLYYFFRYCDTDDEIYTAKDKRYRKLVMQTVKAVGAETHINWFKKFTIKDSTPIYRPNYPTLPFKYGNIFLTGHYMMFPMERTMHTALLSGEKVAYEVMGSGRL